MSISMYQASVPVFLRQLRALSVLLAKGEAFATEQGLDPAELIEARLAPDMFALARQVQIASDAAKGAGRLAQAEVPGFPDTETSFAELQARIEKTIAYVEGLPEEAFEGSETRIVTLKTRDRELSFPGQTFLLHVALPNFFFHVTAAYAILRTKGVPVGKMDFLGGM